MAYIGNQNNAPGIVNAFVTRNKRLVPAGTVQAFAGATVPAGWLLCDGSSYSITANPQYTKLSQVLGELYGNNPNVTLVIPDMRSRFPLASGDGVGAALSNRVLATTGGAETHTLSVGEMPAHTHNFNSANDDFNFSSGAYPTPLSKPSIALNDSGSLIWPDAVLSTGGAGSSSSGGTGADTTPHNNMPPFMVLNYIIKW